MNYIDELEREKSHSDHMKALCRHWMERAQEAELELTRTIAAVVHAAGGEVVVSCADLASVPDMVLTKHSEPWSNSIRFTAKVRPPRLAA